MGELPLIDGGTRGAAARALDRARLLALSRVDFAALTLRRSPTALALRRRICAVACTRLRDRYQQLAGSLVPGAPPGPAEPPTAAELTQAAPPDDYLSNLAFFRDFGADQLRSLVAGSQLFMIPRRRALEREGDASGGCYVTLNGAVEMTIERGRQRIPIGLAGPGGRSATSP
jgi:CRP-like cAMP-binding protein